MREILTIIGQDIANAEIKNHYCLEGLDLDNLPYSRMGEAIDRLRKCTDTVNMTFEHIRPALLMATPDTIYRTTNGIYEEFWTKPADSEGYLIYRVQKVSENRIWTITRWGNMEILQVMDESKDTAVGEIDPDTNYCEKILVRYSMVHR